MKYFDEYESVYNKFKNACYFIDGVTGIQDYKNIKNYDFKYNNQLKYDEVYINENANINCFKVLRDIREYLDSGVFNSIFNYYVQIFDYDDSIRDKLLDVIKDIHDNLYRLIEAGVVKIFYCCKLYKQIFYDLNNLKKFNTDLNKLIKKNNEVISSEFEACETQCKLLKSKIDQKIEYLKEMNNVENCMRNTDLDKLYDLTGGLTQIEFDNINELQNISFDDTKSEKILNFNSDNYGKFIANIKDFNDNIGVDQGVFRFRDFESAEMENLANKFKSKGFSEQNVVKFFNMIDSQGACSYAAMIGNILHYYFDKQEYFETKFGFPLLVDIDGEKKLNTAELLADLYLYMNDASNKYINYAGRKHPLLFKSQDGKIKILTNNAEKQTYLSVDDDDTLLNMEKYFKFHNIDANLSTNIIYSKIDYDEEGSFINKISLEELKKKVIDVIDSPNYNLDIGFVRIGLSGDEPPIPLHSTDIDSPYEIFINNGHAVTGIGYNDEGIIINTWGKLYVMRWNDIVNPIFGGISISATSIVDKAFAK